MSTVDIYRKQGNKISYQGHTCRGEQNIPSREDDRICLDNEAARHLYESEMLLQNRKYDSHGQTSNESGEGYHPAFQNEYLFDKTLLRSETAQCPDIILFLYDEH